MTRTLAALGLLLLAGFVLSLASPLPSLAPDAAVPDEPDRLWQISTP